MGGSSPTPSSGPILSLGYPTPRLGMPAPNTVETVRQADTSGGCGGHARTDSPQRASDFDAPYHHRAIAARVNQPAARRESGHPSVSSALLKNRGILQSNCLTNYLLQVCSGFPSLTYPPNSFGPETRVQRVRVQAEGDAGRFGCGFAKGYVQPIATSPGGPRRGGLGRGDPAVAARPPNHAALAPRRRRRTSSSPPTTAPRRPAHLVAAAVGVGDSPTALAAAAGPRHLAAGADPSPNRPEEVFFGR